jgi:chromate reductase
MATQRKVAVLVGSLRKGSFNRKMAQALIGLAPAQLELAVVEIGNLPLYNQDRDADPPPEVVAFKARIAQSDAVLFVTPEYNRSVPGVLKNALDVGSRPYGKSVWSGKPAAVISVSPGAIGGFGANHHLRQSFVFLDMPALPQPEAYIGNAASLFDDQGALVNASTREFVAKFLRAFAQWIERNAPVVPGNVDAAGATPTSREGARV